jgi:hypothetical protein
MGDPGFWEDSERAAAISAEHSRAARRLEMFSKLAADVEDLDGLVEMASEDDSRSSGSSRAATTRATRS